MAKNLPSTFYHEKWARMGEFMGFRVPIQYSGINEEHRATRLHASLCDASHMGMYIVGEIEKLDSYSIRPIKNLEKGKAKYSVIVDEFGRIVDDGIFYHLDQFYFVGNAATRETLPKFLLDRDIKFDTYDCVKLALQGPKSPEILSKLGLEGPPIQNGCDLVSLEGVEIIISRTGYTGEIGYELFIQDLSLAVRIMDESVSQGAWLCGLGARDTLRLEMGYPLFGFEYTWEHSPLESGMATVIETEGREIAWSSMSNKSQLIFFETIGFHGVPRHGHEIVGENGQIIGHVTSGNKTPFLENPVGFGRIYSSQIAHDDPLTGRSMFVKIRDQLVPIAKLSKKGLRARVTQAVMAEQNTELSNL